MLSRLCPCIFAQPKEPEAAKNDTHDADNPKYLQTLVTLVGYGSVEQKIQAAQKIAMIARVEPRASEHRRALLSMEVLPPLVDCIGPGQVTQHSDKLRAAAAQALCNLALECHDAERRESERGATNEQQDSVLYKALDKVIPGLASLLRVNLPDTSLIACQALSNFMLGDKFVPRVLPLLGPLPDLASHIALHSSTPVKELFAQMVLNAALHNGRASFLDSAHAPEALFLLLGHPDTPSTANERCLCTLYNMIHGEEASARRAAAMLELPPAVPALCSQLLRPQPNCRFLSACLIMRMLHAAAENIPEGEWGPSGSDGNMDTHNGSPAPRRPRTDAAAYRQVVAQLSQKRVLDAVQHALSSCVISSQGFTYGQRAHLLQALVSALHALCAMEDLPQGEPEPSSPEPRVGPMAARLRANNAHSNGTTAARSSSQGGVSAAAGQQQQKPILLLLVGRDTVDKLVQMLNIGGGSGVPDAPLAEACLVLLSLMTTCRESSDLLARAPAVFACLAAILASAVGPRLGSGGGAVTRGSTTPASAAATPRKTDAGARGAAAAAAAAAAGAAMRQAGATYTCMSTDGALGGAMSDDALAWGRCHVLAAKALRNLAVGHPGALLRSEAHKPVVIPSLLIALYYPGRMPAELPLSLQSPRPMARYSGRTGGEYEAGGECEPAWAREVQRHALAALVSLTANEHQRRNACSAFVSAGGLPMIAEVMKGAVRQSEGTPAQPNQLDHYRQTAAWCAALLCRLYVQDEVPCQQQLIKVLVEPCTQEAQEWALRHVPHRALGHGHGPMSKSLHKRGAMSSLAGSVTTLRSGAGPQPAVSGLSDAAGFAPGSASSEASVMAAAVEEAGVVVRLAPVLEGQGSGEGKLGEGGAVARAVGAAGDLLASTAGSRPPADDDAAMDILRSSLQDSQASVRRSYQRPDQLRASIGMQDLFRSQSGSLSPNPAAEPSGPATSDAATSGRQGAHVDAAPGGQDKSAGSMLAESGAVSAPPVDYGAVFGNLQRLVQETDQMFLDGMVGDGDGSGRTMAALE